VSVVGLKNLGNTCYLNSLLQCLRHTPFIKEYFSRRHTFPANEYGDVARAFSKFLQKKGDERYHVVDPRALQTALQASNKVYLEKFEFTGISQKCVYEALVRVLDVLDKATVPPRARRQEGVIRRNMQFTTQNVNVFADGKRQLSGNAEPCQVARVSLRVRPETGGARHTVPGHPARELEYTLKNLLRREFTVGTRAEKVERTLEGKNSAGVYPREDCERVESISSLPSTLMIKLGRKNNYWGPNQFQSRHFGKKFTDEVAFGPRLNIDWLPNSDDVTYELYAISVHSGSGYGGHYFAYVKEGDKWHSVNDRSHRVVPDSTVFGRENRKGVHVLFYRRVEPRTPTA